MGPGRPDAAAGVGIIIHLRDSVCSAGVFLLPCIRKELPVAGPVGAFGYRSSCGDSPIWGSYADC